MDRISCDFEYKFAAGSDSIGEFDGYGAVFNNIDGGGDMIVPGAFSEILQKMAAAGKAPKMLLAHAGMPYAPPTPENMIPIGKWSAISEDSKGLHVAGRLINLDTESGKRIHGAMKEGELNSMSIAFKIDPAKTKYGKAAGEPRRFLGGFKSLPEISLVTFPMNELATVNNVKSFNPRELEDALRDVGLSQSDRKKAAVVFRKMLQRDVGGPGNSHRDDGLSGKAMRELREAVRAASAKIGA